MFIEPQLNGACGGWIEVICGSMFSGKTEELIRRLKRARIANQNVAVFKPTRDVRFDAVKIMSHDENGLHATAIDAAQQLLLLTQDLEVVGIDEAQFFDGALPEVCDVLACRGIRVIVAGLDMDFAAQPFGPMPQLLAKADYITKLHAICVKCGAIAQYSYRKVPDETQIVLGAAEAYEPRCRRCFNLDGKID